MLPVPRPALLFLCVLPLSACLAPPRAVEALPPDATPQTTVLAQVKDDLDRQPIIAAQTATASVVQFTGLGLAQVANQPGKTLNQRRLMAIRAARLEALRDLTEQVHGIQIDASSTLGDLILRNDTLKARVQGEIRGAKTLRITPKGGDSYEVVMALDPDTVRYIRRSAH